MDDRLKQTGADLLNSLSEEELSEAFRELADEPDHQKIAHRIVTQRGVRAITQTSQLVDVIFAAKGIIKKIWRQQRRTSKSGSLHPAALVFQALRILVNDELGCLRELLRVAPYCLRPGGRIGIISFHSGEDRQVENAFRGGLQTGTYAGIVETPIRPTSREIVDNPRSRSAVFRWAVKVNSCPSSIL
jgi:16S rRNA (cytosine1402-N4)-methyltransferase